VGTLVPSAAWASSNGRRNTAIVLGAATLHQALHHKTTNALVLGAGTAYAIKRYNDKRKEERRRHARRTTYTRYVRRTTYRRAR
jgi:hypothetical protein